MFIILKHIIKYKSSSTLDDEFGEEVNNEMIIMYSKVDDQYLSPIALLNGALSHHKYE